METPEEETKLPEQILQKEKYKGLQNLVLICEAMEEFGVKQYEAGYDAGRNGQYNSDLQDKLATLRTAKDQIERDKRDLEKKHENLKEVFKESGERHKAKLMSVYYLLGSIRKMGTHHEKHVAVGYLQSTVDDLVKHDNLSWDQDLFSLPF